MTLFGIAWEGKFVQFVPGQGTTCSTSWSRGLLPALAVAHDASSWADASASYLADAGPWFRASTNWSASTVLSQITTPRSSLFFYSTFVASAPRSPRSPGRRNRIFFAFVICAVHCFLQSRTRSSSVLWILNNIPGSSFISTATSHTAFAPWCPNSSFAVSWNCTVKLASEDDGQLN